MQDGPTRSSPRTVSLLRGIVLLLAITELAAAAYLWYALFVDDTTSWVAMLFPEVSDDWQGLVIPSAIAGALALALGIADRWLWLGLALTLAAPLVTAWLLA